MIKNMLANCIYKKYSAATLCTCVEYCFNCNVILRFENSVIVILTESGKNILSDYKNRIALGKFVRMHSEHKYGFLYNID